MNFKAFRPMLLVVLMLALLATAITAFAAAYLDNNTIHSNQDPNTEMRRSDHFRMNFGHYDRDGGMSETLALGNLQMFEQMWDCWVNELGMHDINESVTNPDGNKYRANFNFLMTWNDGGGGGAWSSMDSGGYFYAMANPAYCRFDPPSGATPHEFGHVWEGSAAGFNGTDSSGAWWECTANWMQLQFLNSYPQAGGLIGNSMYYPCHGRDYYDSWTIWEAAKDNPKYGVAWVNKVWTDATPDQQAHEYIIDRMIRVDTSGSLDKAGAVKDLWGEMANKCVNWDYERKQWLAQANVPESDSNYWGFYQRSRTPMVKMAGNAGWYRPSRDHIPQEFGFNIIPLNMPNKTAGQYTVTCNFQPVCDPVRQSDWRACLVSISNNDDARYSTQWNKGSNSITVTNDENQLYLVVTATPKPMKVGAAEEYRLDSGSQFPYTISLTNAEPKNVVYPKPTSGLSHLHSNGGGYVANTATVDATAYVGPNAMILDSAKVLGNARVEDYAVVRNSAQVRDNAVISGHAMVQDSAQVFDNGKVRDWGRVFGNAQVYQNAKVIEHANCGDNGTTAAGSSVIKGTTYVYSGSTISGCSIWEGDSANGGTPVSKGVVFGWAWGGNAAYFAGLADNGYIYCQHTFEKDHPIWAWDEYGINHGYLMNGCRAAKDTVAPTRGGRVLPLDGVNQYVELHNSANDFKDSVIAVWAKWTGTANDQRIWSMGNGSTKYMYLTPKDGTTGNLRFVINNGATTQYLDGAAAMPANVWTHVAVVFSGSTSTLYVNGASVASIAASAILPDALNAPLMENANYLGRGNVGNYFQGYLDDFRVYSKSLTSTEVSAIYSAAAPAAVTITADTTAPTPNAATWLVTPAAISDSAITMSATPGTDASGWVEYYFQCTSGAGHSSGWVSFNKYTDVGLTPGASYTYTVKMRDKNGNTTTASAAASAVTQTATALTASFAYGPVGIADGKVTMAATKLTSPSEFIEYNFNMIIGMGTIIGTSGWQSSPTYTFTSGMNAGSIYSYNVQVRDRRGNTSALAARKSATAKDMTAPKLPITIANWNMRPYSTIDNKISMTAYEASDLNGVQYYFECVSGGGPNSGWQDTTTYLTDALADGTYQYRYKTRDKSAQANESGYSTTYSATISPTTGYHNYLLSQVLTQPDDTMVSFSGVVMRVNANNYLVKDLSSNASIMVRPSTYGEVTNPLLALKVVTVKGHLYTYSDVRQITYAYLTETGNPANSVSGKVTNASGAPIAGATVYFSDVANASANTITTATTDASGNYTRGLTDGTWHIAAGANDYVTSADQIQVINGANITGADFTLAATPRVTGKVTQKSDGAAIAGATVYFSKTANASASPTWTITTDASGNYNQGLQPGTWFISASATNFYASSDQSVIITSVDMQNINFVLKSSTRNVPRPEDLMFSCVTDSFPASGTTGDWASYLPAGNTFAMIGTPSVEIINGIKWEKNVRIDGVAGANCGYTVGTYALNEPINGITIVAAVKPTYNSPAIGGEARGEVVDFGYGELFLAVAHNTGEVIVCSRNYSQTMTGYKIPNRQTTILSLVVEPTGQLTLFANGVQKWTKASGIDYTVLKTNNGNSITIGRNAPDGWSAYNGNIGDIFCYKVALTAAERQQIEADVMGKFTGSTIIASATAGGTITPSGVLPVDSGENQTYAMAASAGYTLTDVKVDGVSQGAITSYTFTNITASHTIAATFTKASSTITATAGAGGSISPAGAISVNNGANQLFTLTPNPGYAISTLKVDGIATIAAGAYTFNNVIADHTIDATFAKPVGMNNKAALTDANAQGKTVKVWGKVVSINGATSFVINDGYNAAGITIMTNAAILPVPFTTSSTVIVTGVLSKIGDNAVVYAQKVSAQ